MKVNCVICTETFTATSLITALHCGHCFHSVCIERWMQQARTCPQCRTPINMRSIVTQLYFTANADETINADSYVQIGELEDKVTERDQHILNHVTEITSLKNQYDESAAKLHNLEKILDSDNRKNKKLVSDVRQLLRENADLVNSNNEMGTLQRRVQRLQNISDIIGSSATDIDVYSSSGVDELRVMCGILKRELTSKRVQNKTLNKSIHEMRVKSNAELNAQKEKIDKLKEENETLKLNLCSSEDETSSLRKKITLLQNSTNTPKTVELNSKRFVNESPIPISFTPDIPKKKRYNIILSDSEEEAGKVRISKKYTNNTEKTKSTLKFNVLKNRRDFGSLMSPQESCQRKGYNGFGGHSSHIHTKPIFKKP